MSHRASRTRVCFAAWLLAVTCAVASAAGQSSPVSNAAGPYSSVPSQVAPANYVEMSPPLPAASAPAPLPPAGDNEPVTLTPSDGRAPTKLPPAGDGGTRRTGGSGVVSILGSLGLVLGLFMLAAYVVRRGLPKQSRALPKEAIDVLGRIALPCRQQGQLLRVGNRMVLVSFSSGGADVLAEITDPAEVDRLSGLCAQHDTQSATKSFRDVVEGFFREKPAATKLVRSAAEDADVA